MLMKSRLTLLVVMSVLLVAPCTVAAAQPIYVDENASGANNGSSWTDAYTFLQEALADADLGEKPVEIRVAQGTQFGGAFRLVGDCDILQDLDFGDPYHLHCRNGSRTLRGIATSRRLETCASSQVE